MTDKKISELDAITGANTAATDVFVVVDTSAGQTKKITREELNNAIERDVLDSIDIDTINGDFTVNGNITISGTVDGRDISTDGTKLDGIAAGAEVNAVDSVNTQTGAVVLDADDISDAATANKFTTAADISKLAGIEALADVTDATNVAAAGAAMLTGATFTGNVSFGDSNKAIFGAGSDLQIYHDGLNSRIQDAGTGNLIIRASAGTYIQGVNGENGVVVLEDGAVSLWNNGSQKLATTSTGIDVTGTVTADAGNVTGEFIAQSYNETYDALSGTTPTVDCHNGNMFNLTTSGNTTFTFSNPPASGTAFGFTLKLVAGGTHTITYPASVDWAGGSAPDAPASGETDVLVFITHDGGTTWYGFRAGDAMA